MKHWTYNRKTKGVFCGGELICRLSDGLSPKDKRAIALGEFIATAPRIIEELAIQANEDCPRESRSVHFIEALREAAELLDTIDTNEPHKP